MNAVEKVARGLKIARTVDRDMALTEAAHKAGLTEMTLRNIENGEIKRPSFLQVMRLCRLYQLDPWSLL